MADCSEGDEYIKSTKFKVVLAIQVLVSILAVITNVRFFHSDFKKIYFHANAKIIISISLFFNIAHSVLVVILQGTHLTLFLTSDSGCNVYVAVPFCVSLRGMISVPMAGYIPVNIAMVIERKVATMKPKTYEKSSKCLGIVLGILAVIASFLMVILSQYNTPLTGTSPYCSAINKYTADNITMWSYIQTVAEFCAIFVFLSFWFINRYRQQTRVYNFAQSYQLRENITSLNVLIPWMMFHFATFIIFHVANSLIPFIGSWNENPMDLKTAYAAAYIIPIYCCLSPFLLNWVVWKQKQNRLRQFKKITAEPANGRAYEMQYTKDW